MEVVDRWSKRSRRRGDWKRGQGGSTTSPETCGLGRGAAQVARSTAAARSSGVRAALNMASLHGGLKPARLTLVYPGAPWTISGERGGGQAGEVGGRSGGRV